MDRRYEVHGVADHRYELRAPLTSDELAAAEAQFGVSLPEDYAFFLTELGAGGAGPGYGLFPLVLDERTWKWSDEDGQRPGDLASPFPHTSEWNFDDHPLWADQPTESQFADVEAFEDADSTWRDDLEALFWQPQHTRGAVCLGHLGCGLLAWLVVSGPERGHVWFDGRAECSGFAPMSCDGLERLTFAPWYERWLDDTLVAARTLPPPPWHAPKRWPR